MQLAAFFCRITLLNVLTVGTYIPAIGFSDEFHENFDLNRIPHRQRGSYAYARGLVADVLDSTTRSCGGDGTFQEDVYLPLLRRTVQYLRGEFESRHGKKDSEGAGRGFWRSPRRRAMFHAQLDAAVANAPGFHITGEPQPQGQGGSSLFEVDVSSSGYEFGWNTSRMWFMRFCIRRR